MWIAFSDELIAESLLVVSLKIISDVIIQIGFKYNKLPVPKIISPYVENPI